MDRSRPDQFQGEAVDIPLGIASVLPGRDLVGMLIPSVKLAFDLAPDSVRTKLSAPDSLTVEWPIRGRVANLHDWSLPAQLSWIVYSGVDDKIVLRTTPANGRETVVKIDGGGRFEVLVDNKAPILDLVAAGLVGSNKVGYALALTLPPGASVQNGTDKLTVNLACSVSVATTPATDLRLGDKATYSVKTHDLLKKIPLELRVVEQDSKDGKGTGDKIAMRYLFRGGKLPEVNWTLGFADPDGSWAKFSYSEESEEGNFDYGWELHAQSPTTGELTRVLFSTTALSVLRPTLKDFYVNADNPAQGDWTVAGKIEGFRDAEPRIRVALALVDGAHTCYPADLTRSAQVVLRSDQTFQKSLKGPKLLPGPDGSTPPAQAFAILSLVATWDGKGGQNPISGFLAYDDDKFALFDPNKGTSWEKACAWIASQESTGIAPRGKKPSEGGLHIPAPGPEAGGDQKSALTLDETVLDLLAWEGEVAHLYLDSKGYMTIGIGTCLVTKDAPKSSKETLKLSLRIVDSDRFATDSDPLADDTTKQKVFDKIAAMAPKMSARDYRTQPRLALTKADVHAMVQKFIDKKAQPAMDRNFPDNKNFPKCARRAIVDILYNCGPGFLDGPTAKTKAKAPKLRAAILAQDWKTAAAEVPTAGRAERRQWRMDLFGFAEKLKGQKERVS